MNSLLAAPSASLSRVIEWLHANGITEFEVTGGRFVTVKTSVEMAEELLQVNYRLVHHSASHLSLYRSFTDYTLPLRIARVVDVVGGVTRFPSKYFPRGTLYGILICR